MTLNEFKAWLEGFEASILPKGTGPNATQWAAIKAKLATVQMLSPAPYIPPVWAADWPFSKPIAKWSAAEAPTYSDCAQMPRDR